MAWYTGEACGFTATLSSPLRCPNHREVMIPTIEAELAWWPPTFTAPAGRSWLAWSTMRTASQRIRCWTTSSVARSAGEVVAMVSTMVGRLRRGGEPGRRCHGNGDETGLARASDARHRGGGPNRPSLICAAMDVKGAAAIVSGGASGLGEATVRRLHAAGAVVTIIDFNSERGEALAKELGVKFVKCDVTDTDQVAEAVAAAAEDAPLRIAINCAGTGTAVRTIGKDGTPHIRSEWDRVLSINLLGTMLCMTHEASVMSRSDPLDGGVRGVIVNTASVAAF